MSDLPSRRAGFLIIGAQKAGTTALHAHLRRCKGLFLPEPKELHFFDAESGVDWNLPDYAAYEACFGKAPPGYLCGEATPYYMFVPECLDRIRAYNPAMKLVAVLRDPVARAISNWRMETTRGAEDATFSYAIRAGRSRAVQNPQTFSYIERGLYAGQIEQMLRRFPAGNCHFLLHDDLIADPDACLGALSGFLGCGVPAKPAGREEIGYFQSDPSLAPPSPDDITYLRNLYRDDIQRTAELIGRDLSRWLAGTPT